MPAKRHYTSYTKQELIDKRYIIDNQTDISIVYYLTNKKYENEPESSHVTCHYCNSKFMQLDSHLKKWHNKTAQEYQLEYPNGKLVCQHSIDRVSGDKNPASGHGGRYSKYSKNFIKYDGLSDEEIKQGQLDVANKSKETKRANPHNENTKIEYYTSRGMGESGALIALSERQSTFSLKTCVHKYGDYVGNMIFESRQILWQNTLNAKSKEELERIYRMCAPKTNYASRWNNLRETPTIFYVIKFAENLYKYGITTKKTIKDRYSSISADKFEIIHQINHELGDVSFKIEQVIKETFKKYYITKDESNKNFGWTECLKLDSKSLNLLIESINRLNNNSELLETMYNNAIKTPKTI